MTHDEIFQLIKNNVLEILPEIPSEEILIDISLKDLGANSIDRVEIITMTMEDLGIKIPMVDFGNIKNIRGLADFFFEKQSSTPSATTV
ncbi:MAG: acyl carrier protein [bacterium]|nr:acyl carrier protein [bacterium]